METIIIPILIQYAPQLMGAIITAIIAYIGKKTSEYVSQKTKNESVNNAIAHITHTANTIVADLEQTVIPYYVSKQQGGKLNKEEREAIKNIAISRIKKQLPEAITELAGIAVNSVDKLIAGKIEQAVINLKK